MIGTSQKLLDMHERENTFERAIDRNSSLYDRIIDSLSVGQDNLVYLIPEHTRIERITIKIACGLYSKRYKQARPIADFRHVGTYQFDIRGPKTKTLIIFTHKMHFIPKKWTIIQKDTFSYIVIRDWQTNKLLMFMNFHNTLWSCIELKPPKRRYLLRYPKEQLFFIAESPE